PTQFVDLQFSIHQWTQFGMTWHLIIPNSQRQDTCPVGYRIAKREAGEIGHIRDGKALNQVVLITGTSQRMKRHRMEQAMGGGYEPELIMKACFNPLRQ